MSKAQVFKFGGASVKNADAVRNVAKVIGLHHDQRLIIVISAMGKTTNAFELLLNAMYHNTSMVKECWQEIVDYHNDILRDLFPDFSHDIYTHFSEWQSETESVIENTELKDYDFDYDQLVGRGELISTRVVCEYLKSSGFNAIWVDARQLIKTDSTYREAKVDWEATEQSVHKKLNELGERLVITQGFIGSDDHRNSTTLGREGSDFTAAILAYSSDAESMTIWKDVPGVLNADPKWFDNTIKLDKISYLEAIELAYYGASIIHPKTIKPLENKKIPLYAKSFLNPEKSGTVIQESRDYDRLIPSFIFKVDQILISIIPKDFSFIIEENLEHIFSVFARRRVKVRLMQNSALNFSVCADMDDQKIPGLLEELKVDYNLKYNENLELVTIRHFDEPTISRVTVNKEILVDQRTRQTVRMVMKNL